jgi:hypothetical protein
MATIQKRNAITKKFIRTPWATMLFEDEEMLERVRALHSGVAPAGRRAVADVQGATSSEAAT